MKLKKAALILISFLALLSLLTLSSEPGQKKKTNAKVKEEKIFIPQEIKTVIEEGLASRLPRMDIPFEIVRFLYLPAQQNAHAIFLFNIKNADLGFKPRVSDAETEKKSQSLQADFEIFAQFYEIENKNVGKTVKESYVPASFKEDSSTFKPEKVNIYSIGYPLPAGNYLLALVITSADLTKIGLQYFEFSLPDFLPFRKKLGLTPVFFMKSLKQHESPELITKVHRNSFVYSTLEISPKIKNVFSQGETLDIFYFIYGCQSDSGTKQFEIEISYQVKKGKVSTLKFKEKSFSFPLVSHPLPLLDKNNQPLGPGTYVLEISAKDKISGHSVKEPVEFEIK